MVGAMVGEVVDAVVTAIGSSEPQILQNSVLSGFWSYPQAVQVIMVFYPYDGRVMLKLYQRDSYVPVSFRISSSESISSISLPIFTVFPLAPIFTVFRVPVGICNSRCACWRFGLCRSRCNSLSNCSCGCLCKGCCR